ncbi:hypothetical protein EVAR_78390_1 [Eumeta japonica]|uniref:Uncharacterized protein n=1 Tax=Eumeta variegata TaxID=151549 RepID=A0A4C1T4M1_EUMVA|nr:hypothetical protein EVAR_78390_1 [Eumeta japonica]
MRARVDAGAPRAHAGLIRFAAHAPAAAPRPAHQIAATRDNSIYLTKALLYGGPYSLTEKAATVFWSDAAYWSVTSASARAALFRRRKFASALERRSHVDESAELVTTSAILIRSRKKTLKRRARPGKEKTNFQLLKADSATGAKLE